MRSKKCSLIIGLFFCLNATVYANTYNFKHESVAPKHTIHYAQDDFNAMTSEICTGPNSVNCVKNCDNAITTSCRSESGLGAGTNQCDRVCIAVLKTSYVTDNFGYADNVSIGNRNNYTGSAYVTRYAEAGPVVPPTCPKGYVAKGVFDVGPQYKYLPVDVAQVFKSMADYYLYEKVYGYTCADIPNTGERHTGAAPWGSSHNVDDLFWGGDKVFRVTAQDCVSKAKATDVVDSSLCRQGTADWRTSAIQRNCTRPQGWFVVRGPNDVPVEAPNALVCVRIDTGWGGGP